MIWKDTDDVVWLNTTDTVWRDWTNVVAVFIALLMDNREHILNMDNRENVLMRQG